MMPSAATLAALDTCKRRNGARLPDDSESKGVARTC